MVERNFRCKGGEIDLVMQDGEALVFVEVRKRADQRHGGAAASITPAKQKRLIVAAQHYLQRYRMPPPCRFDDATALPLRCDRNRRRRNALAEKRDRTMRICGGAAAGLLYNPAS
jgi:putative endonuclease